jgi:hypothetical protein
MYISLHVKHQMLWKLELYRQIFAKYSNTEFHGNPSSVSRMVPRGQTDERA